MPGVSAWSSRDQRLSAHDSPERPEHQGSPACQGWELGCDAPTWTRSLGILHPTCLHTQPQGFYGHLRSVTCCQWKHRAASGILASGAIWFTKREGLCLLNH